MKITKRKKVNTKIKIGFYVDKDINLAMLAAAESAECSRNDILTHLVELGLKDFLGKKPDNMKEQWLTYED